MEIISGKRPVGKPTKLKRINNKINTTFSQHSFDIMIKKLKRIIMRYKYLDFLRQIALFYMFFQHAVLVLLKSYLNDGIILFLFEIVPFCPALFLFLAGFSITLHLKKNNLDKIEPKYFLHLFSRGLLLIFCASILFVIEHGFQFPEFFLCGNILNTIGWMIIISGLILMNRHKEIISVSLFIILSLIFIILDIHEIRFLPLTYGYEPMLPTMIFGFMGLSTGLLLNKINDGKKMNISVISIGTTGLALFSFYSFKYGIFKVFYSDIGRYFIKREFNEKFLVQNIISGNNSDPFYTASVWNYNTECFIASIGFILVMFAVSFYLEKTIFKKINGNFFIPGKFAFFNYFYHLSIISIIALFFGFNLMNTAQLLIFLSLLFLFSYVLSFLFQIIRQKMEKSGN